MFFVPETKKLLKAVQGFWKFAYYIAISFNFGAFRNFYIDKLINEAI